MNTLKIPNVSRIINISIAVCLYVLVGNAAVDLVPCDRTRRVFTDTWGVITDGPLGTNYTQDSHCEWLIKANGTKKFITLSFRSMGTECSYDYVFVYDGDSFRSPLLGSFSGKTEPQRVVAASGHMLILLYSDTNYVLEGFRAEFSITNCANNCSGHGVCFKNRCTCDGDWGGFDCSRKVCPDDCGRKYSHGRCVAGICVCNDGYSGQSCSLYRRELKGNRWHWLSHSEGGLTPRAAHSAVYVEATDSLYVFGGYNLNYVLSNLEIYSFSNSTWYDENGQPLPDRTISSTIDPSSIAKLIEHAGPDWEHKWGINSGTSFLRNLFYTVSDNSTFPRRRQRHSKFPDSKKPSARFGHAACVVPDGFLIYGGKLDNGSLSNDLWLYDVRRNKWELRAALSDVQPPPLTRHTLTLANGSVYLFGGSTSDGEFSSLLYSIRLRPSGDEKWVLVKPRGGKELDVRVVAHSTVYHEPSNSLLVYGGIKAGIARFSKLSDRMFAFDLERKHWAEIHYTRGHLRENFVPSERAFHTANILGNYLVVFGGYSHRHNKDEICYDNQMYLYHLGCHIWVNPEILGKTNGSAYPKQQGVFAHASAIRLGNTLLLVGGYHGNVNGDLLAYTVPPMIASHSGEPYDPEAVCSKHHHYTECSADPECGWCSADDSCYGRMIGTNCTTNLQTTRCPGVCPALGDCRSCLIHGDAAAATKRPLASAAQKLGLGVCTWCVQNARCHHKDDNYGVCGLREDSPSKMPGWWGSAGTEVDSAEKCRELDKRPGLTFVKYHHPANFSQPDHVAIINATTVDFSGPLSYSLRLDSFSGGRMVARLMGFLRPPAGWRETLDVCVSYCNASLRLSEDVLVNVSASHTECGSAQWPENLTSHRVPVDLEAQKTVSIGPYNNRQDEQSKMELQHRSDGDDPAKVFTFEYLEPYANGTCSQYQNCLHCLTDSECGWCEASGACVSRHDDENVTCSSAGNDGSDWRYLTLQPAACPNCSDHISCESCVSTRTCEWWLEEAKCARIGQAPDAAVSPHQCPTPCYKRADCTGCLEERGRCVWCEATQQCFSFSVYTSEYQFGMCRVWLDQVYPLAISQDNGIIQSTKVQEKCKSCSHHDNCSNCLSSLSCGWCYNASNPMTGVCVQGDFNAPHSNCSELLSTSEARWAYAQCPDVDECGLGLHDCHPQAVCTNTDGSFSCHCRKGYVGDGRTTCRRTCYNVCVHGVCQEEPDYSCRCDLGWFGDDCSKNCGCNNHSMCPQGEGVCEKCMDWTTGERCEFCVPGSYGNATTEQGCRECSCNGHGDKLRGECDIATGVCFCQDNTEGEKCEKCKVNYWGDPRNGRQCYYQCEARGMLSGPKGQGISSRQAYSAPWGGTPIRECLWIINPQVESGGVIIQLQVNASDLNVTCGENAVYVYDSSPDLLDMGSQSALSAVLCSEEALPSAIVESRTGQLTVHYKQGLAGEGFSAIYKVIHCGDDCEFPRRCRNGQCVCEDGLSGPRCELILCPNNCSYSLNRGTCNKDYGRCICKPGWAGPSCDTKITGKELVFVELFNTMHLAEHLEHLRKTLPRFGHSLATDRRGSLWMFGGYSLSHGPLNDIRLFDTRNSTWNQVTVESTPDAKMPRGRYFHGADIVHSKQAIYIYGGLTRAEGTDNTTLDDLWQFDIQNQRWGKVEQKGDWPPSLCGHTLTYYRNATTDSLILIGGVSPEFGFSSSVWEFQIQGKEKWTLWQTKGKGPLGIFGHSTVFHMQSNSLYIFGGYEHERQRSLLSNKLYRLQYETRTWMELNSLGVSSFGLPMARFLHSAVSTDSHMIVMGGRLHPWNVNDTLYAYSYDCNQWINLLSNETRTVGQLPGQTFAQAMTIEPDGDAAYIIGGWGSDSQCSVYRIELPEDLCSVWPKRHGCLHVPGCGFCRNREGDDDGGFCYDNQLECPIGNFGFSPTDLANHSGKKCKGLEILGDCRRFHNCTMCVQAIGCGWCNGACTTNATCPATTLSHCPYSHCQAADCRQCREISGCDWNKLKRKCVKMVHDQPTPSDDRDCQPCVEQTTCTDCLERHDCRWSTQLDECISASYQPIYCAGGVCGLVLQSDDRQYCPEPCSSFSQCSKCLSHAHCGWCAVPGETGEGICTDGSSEKPKLESCANVHALMKDMEVDFDPTNISYTWHYIKCPPENECENDHHSCEEESEVCVDLEEGFQCVCGSGYKLGLNGCEPVCQQGCVRGQCVHPNKCQCDFGYVGANCSIQCVCNGHSDCEGPDKLDKCLKCHNNTMGDRCEKCLPFFVGDPTNNGQCVSCLEYCNGHTDVCVDNNLQLPEPPPDTDLHRFYQFVVEGPKEEARCIHCANYTTGDRCEKCIDGNFRGSEDHRDPCKPCMCHGHGDTCDPVTGDNCNCQNNTESDVCSGSGSVGKNSATPCYMVQCSKCKEGYLGTPKDGHQCYKTLQVDLKMCFDAKPIDECKAKPRALHPGEMVFFAIQPRYMNVNIRIMIDVTQGELNVFMSTHDDTYLAYPNSSLLLDDQYKQYNGSRRSEEILDEQDAVGLRTYITVRNPKTILAVRGLTDRLVITLPEEYHKLETTRFYLVLQAVDPPDTDKKAAYGTVFARQDQLHIDLFVFFSVFFSCFFLFLAACVVAWKAKQAADIRRARRRHVVEMLHMAKRPFATVTLNLGPRIKPKKSAHYDLRPVAVEPTDDGLAAVATVFVSLPGGNSPTVKLALASSLILLARQFPSGGRAFLRRRSTHAAPPI